MMPKSTGAKRAGVNSSPDDEEIAGMHVGVEVVVTEHLGEEELDTLFSQVPEIDPGADQALDIGNPDTDDTFHDEHVLARVVPEHLRHVHRRVVGEVAPELGSIGRLPHHVEFVEDGLLELRHDHGRFELLAADPVTFGEVGDDAHQRDVLFDRTAQIGAHDLDDDLVAVTQPRGVDLGDRRRGQRDFVEVLKTSSTDCP